MEFSLYMMERYALVGGGGGTAQIPGATPGPNRRGLAGNMMEHKEGVEGLEANGKDAVERGGR